MPQTTHAAIVWGYATTDGTDTLSGMLTTNGNPGDELTMDAVFNLFTIDNAFFNGTLVTHWAAGIAPPFGNSNGSIIVDTPGNALVNPGTGNLVQAGGDLVNAFNFITLARPGTGADSSVSGLISGDIFIPNPISTTFTAQASPVPTPSTMLLMGTGLLGLIGYRKWINKAN